jgi:iron complex outermembrane receptor protein
MKSDQNYAPWKKALAASLLLGVALPGLQAQAQTPAPAANDPQEDFIRLSEFRVDATRDSGYLATNSTAGTRLNTPIKELPMQLEVITRDFIEDIGAVDFKEALLYSAGVVQDTVQGANNFLFSPSGTGQAGALNPDGTAINIRGYNTRFLLRNGFRLDTVADTVNVGRQELVRGPQALLYGVSALAGIVNVDPRYPRSTPSNVVRFSVGSYDFRRIEAFSTGPLLSGDRLRVNYGAGLVYHNQGNETQFANRERYLVTPAFDIQIGPRTNVFVDLELGKFKREGTGDQDFQEPNIGNVRNPAGLLGFSNLDEFRDPILIGRDRRNLGRNIRWTGPDSFEKTDYFNVTTQLTQRVGDQFQVLAGVNYNYTESDFRNIAVSVQQTSAPTRPTTPGEWVDDGQNPLNPAQRLWRSFSYNWTTPERRKEILQTRVDALYNFELFGNRQDILIGRQDVQVVQLQKNNAQVVNNAGVANSASFKAYDDNTPFRFGGERQRPTTDSKFWEWNTGHYVVIQSKWWNERINAIGGYRWDRYHVRTLDFDYVKRDPSLGNEVIDNWIFPDAPRNNGNSPPGAAPVVNGYRFGGKVQKDGNATYGLSYRLSDAINLFALSGSGIFPNTGQRDGAGNPFQAEKTKGIDIGIKADLWKTDGGRPRISLQAGAYRVERENAIYNVFWAPQPRSNDRNRDRGSGVPVGGRIAMGTGPNAYGVYSSGYLDFQTDRPVTYLLPLSYVAPGDLNHPRVTGAPQLNNFILVDYASLGSSANDPLRRAMDAAASDPVNLTALQTGATGAGATGLFANNAYAFNRNSDVAYNDKSEGFDASVILNLTSNYTATLGYSYIKQEVTGGFRVVNQPGGTEYDSWWNFMGIPLEERRALGGGNTGAVDFGSSAVGNRTIDAPIRQFTMWNRYQFDDGMLKGVTVGLGLIHQAERQAEIALDNGGRTRRDGRENQRFRPNYPSDTKVNASLGYRTRFRDLPVNFQLNINNLLNDQKDEARGSSTMFINPATGAAVASTTPGAQQIEVPERARIYFTPITFRFSATVSF